MEKNYLETQIKPDLKKLLRQKEHLLNQIETYVDMQHNCKLALNKVNNEILEIQNIIDKLKDPS